MRKMIIAGNWKMHMDVSQASTLVHRLQERIRIHRDVEVVLCPSMLHLQPLSLQIDRRKFRLAAQNAYFKDEGAYTGEVSFTMLHDLVHYVVVGHSERRHIFGEGIDMVRDKVTAAIRNGIDPILCVGETKAEKAAGETTRVIHDQLVTAVANLTAAEVSRVVVAYEPIWALSSGTDFANHESATPEQLAKAVHIIRENIKALYGERAANKVRVIYGGSSNSENAYSYLSVEGVDGLLPGGASLNYEEFSKMVSIADRVVREREQKQ